MSAHTPGPWHFAENNIGAMQDHGYCLIHGEPVTFGWEQNLFVVVGASSNAVRSLGKGAPEANARLIAAAPELLEALCELLAAQLSPIPPYEMGIELQNAWSSRRAAAKEQARAAIAKATGAA